MLRGAKHQTLLAFCGTSAETIDGIERTGEAEYLTVDGQPKAVLLTPRIDDALMNEVFLFHDVAAIQQSMREFREGKGQEVGAFFAELRSKRLASPAASTSPTQSKAGLPKPGEP